jgi:hypothetical protein
MISIDNLVAGVMASTVTGIVTALVSVRLALRRFRSERLWDRKMQAYSSLFDALYHVKAYTERVVDQLEVHREIDSEHMKDVSDRSVAGYREIRKAVVVGTFILGPEAVTRLEKLERTLDDPHHNDDLYEEVSADLKAVTSAIDDLRPIAKRDLQAG